MSSSDVLAQLQRWYSEQGDGEWEHSFGVVIESLDNRGSRVRVDVEGTPLRDRSHERVEDHRSDDDWVVLWRDAQPSSICQPTRTTTAASSPCSRTYEKRTPGRPSAEQVAAAARTGYNKAKVLHILLKDGPMIVTGVAQRLRGDVDSQELSRARRRATAGTARQATCLSRSAQ